MKNDFQAIMGLEEKVDLIQERIYEINNIADTLLGHAIIESSWEDFKRYKTMKIACQNDNDLEQFAKVVYNITYESTKKGTIKKSTFPKSMQNDLFLDIAGELRNKYSHARDGYVTNKIKIKDIYERYQDFEIINDGDKPLRIYQESTIEDGIEFKKSTNTNSSKIKIINSMKKELINGSYIKLRFDGKLSNNKIDSTIMELLNEFKATKRELNLIPLNENESQIIFQIITKNSHTITNMEILRKYGWYIKI